MEIKGLLPQLLIIALILVSVILSIYLKKLTVSAGITGGLLSIILFYGLGVIAISALALFFLLGITASYFRKEEKITINNQYTDSKTRKTGQVIANAGVPGIVAILSLIIPDISPLLLLMLIASFSSATADTLSSEIGVVIGKRTFDILTFRQGIRGEDGVISLEGLAAGLIGSIFIGLVYTIFQGWQFFIWIIIAGLVGNLIDSYLGATLERKGLIGNNTVNFLSNLTASIFIIPIYYLIA